MEKTKQINVGIDIGGTNTRVGLVKDDQVTEVFSKITNNSDPIENFKWIVDQINIWKKTWDIKMIGVSCPGPLDIARGMILETSNLAKKWNHFSITDHFAKHCQIPAIINNDANVQAYANAVIGVAKKYRVVQYYALSTGLGAGLVVDGKIFEGSSSFAQEVANVPVGLKGFKTGRLIDGAIESVASGTGLLALAQNLGSKAKTTKEVFEEHSKFSNEAIEIAQEATARLIATGIAFINPDAIVLSGPLAVYYPEYIKRITELAEEMLFKTVRGKAVYLISDFGDNAGIIGAGNLK